MDTAVPERVRLGSDRVQPSRRVMTAAPYLAGLALGGDGNTNPAVRLCECG